MTRFLTQHVTNHPGRSLERPIGTITTKQQWALVDDDQIRMLTITELRRAMGFPEEYDLPSTKELAGRMLGNAVCPPVASELVRQVKVAT
jgi:DNA (cytosine-5)-methyltransferase 1